MDGTIRILHLEDNRNDAELVEATLAADGFVCETLCVETRVDFAAALERGGFDLIISDFGLPSYNGRSALDLAQRKAPHVPFVFFSGTIGEEAAIDALTAGATDYVLKQRPARLLPAVRRALREAEERAERKRAEEALREINDTMAALIQSSPVGIIVLDLNDAVTVWSPAAEQIFGWRKDEVLGKPLPTIPADQMEEYKALRKHVIEKESVTSREVIRKRKDGALSTISLSIAPQRDADGNICGILALMEDITSRKQLEEQLRQAQKMEAIGQLTGGIAHDFNNLLTIINGYTEMLLQTLPANDPQRENAAQVKEAGDRAVTLTRQLLAFSRRQMLEPKVLDLNAIVTNGEKMLQRMIGEDIRVATALTAQLGRVKADPGQIEQVIMNLAVNARDAMPHGGKITIETANVELDENYTRQHPVVQPGPYVMLAVSDTGSGMDAATQKRIFEPFFTTKGLGKGTGLGLSTVYGIVKQSGGSIWVYSEVGKGTTFKVYLPRVEQKPDTVPPQSVREALLNGTETILLVEDDAPLRKLTQAIFQKGGYTVLSADGGDDAFRLCATHKGPIHLLVTDVVMPGMSGRELAERMESAYPDVKVLYISGYTDDTVVRHGVLDQRMAFLQKPFTMHGLLRKVRAVLDSGCGSQT